MTDRINGLFVTLENATRDDDVQGLVDAIRQLRNVADVSLNVQNFDAHIAKTTARMDLTKALSAAINDF